MTKTEKLNIKANLYYVAAESMLHKADSAETQAEADFIAKEAVKLMAMASKFRAAAN